MKRAAVHVAAQAAHVALIARVVVVVGSACVGGCGVDIDAVGPTRLLATDPALLESARAMIFTFTSGAGCADLIDASADDIEGAVAAEADPSIQRIPMLRGQVDPDRGDPDFEDGDATHTFGEVPSGKAVAMLALAVDQDPGADFTIADLSGTIFAIACREVTLEPGKRIEVPLVLTPAGLR